MKPTWPLFVVSALGTVFAIVGAFFGPGAEETGGVFKIDQGSAALLYGTYGLARTAP